MGRESFANSPGRGCRCDQPYSYNKIPERLCLQVPKLTYWLTSACLSSLQPLLLQAGNFTGREFAQEVAAFLGQEALAAKKTCS